MGQQLLRGDQKENRKSNRCIGFAEAHMEQQEIKDRQYNQSLDHMCLQCATVRLGNADPKRNRQEETIGIRDEMLSSDPTKQLEGYDEKRRYP